MLKEKNCNKKKNLLFFRTFKHKECESSRKFGKLKNRNVENVLRFNRNFFFLIFYHSVEAV